MLKTLTLTTAAASLAFAAAHAGDYGDKKTAKVSIEIEGISEEGGKVFVALQNEDEFPKLSASYATTAEADDDEVEVTFEDVKPGKYAVAVFQDTDGNGTLTMDGDRPSEPYAFSGEVTGAPTFADASTMIEGETEIEIDLD